jgi:hypothetical protein
VQVIPQALSLIEKSTLKKNISERLRCQNVDRNEYPLQMLSVESHGDKVMQSMPMDNMPNMPTGNTPTDNAPMGNPADMAMLKMHNTFWRNDQITVLFQSNQRFITDGVLSTAPVQQVDLPKQLQQLNAFLGQKQVPATLQFLNEGDSSAPNPPTPSPNNLTDSSKLPAGVYPFSFPSPIQTDSGLGPINTSFISFLKVVSDPARGGGGNVGMTSRNGGAGNEPQDAAYRLIPTIVRTLNDGLQTLRDQMGVPITIAAPVWLSGGTPGGGDTGEGCPLTPPMPVTDACGNWHITLPNLPANLQGTTGQGVTVFVLDALPERGVIARAAHDAGDNNQLLHNVDATVTFDYSILSGVQATQSMLGTLNAFVGKDVYGRHYPIQLPDHGLFVAGIVRDVAPNAKIECIRVLDDLCVGDVHWITNALWNIYNRAALASGDLYRKPVVINLSLVIPTLSEADAQGVTMTGPSTTNPLASVLQPLKALSELGVIIAASAGNEGDQRDMPGSTRPPALYPAAFGNPPDSLIGIIPVGAMNGKGGAASYSCYPGPRGVATYGGELPNVTPPNPPSSNPTIDISTLDMPRGLYSSVEYPPLSSDPPGQYYAAPNTYAWAYWVGTSFATPIVSGLAARMLEAAQSGNILSNVHDAIINVATDTVTWDRLDPSIGISTGTTTGPALMAQQQ